MSTAGGPAATSGGLIPCAGHGKFRSENASSDVGRASWFEFDVEQPVRADINPVVCVRSILVRYSSVPISRSSVRIVQAL